jgi:thiamine biosynthesis lipoprotein
MPLTELLPLTPAVRQWDVWGTIARIVVTEPDLADVARLLVSDYLDQVDTACSRFRHDSELAIVQRRLKADPSLPVAVSPLLADLITAGLRAAARTDGDVDPTLADDLAALGYDRDYASIALTRPAGVTIRLRRRIRHRWADVRLIESTDVLGAAAHRLLMPAGVHLDLGSSAKAFAADRAAALVSEQLGCGVLVSLGGDIATAGTPPVSGWQVLVQDGPDEPAADIRLDIGALATSSTLSRRWRQGTSAVHHILDPASGRPAEPIWRTVSIAATTCAEANALSTASIVRGWRALPWLRSTGHAARLVGTNGEVIRLGGWPVES